MNALCCKVKILEVCFQVAKTTFILTLHSGLSTSNNDSTVILKALQLRDAFPECDQV